MQHSNSIDNNSFEYQICAGARHVFIINFELSLKFSKLLFTFAAGAKKVFQCKRGFHSVNRVSYTFIKTMFLSIS